MKGWGENFFERERGRRAATLQHFLLFCMHLFFICVHMFHRARFKHHLFMIFQFIIKKKKKALF